MAETSYQRTSESGALRSSIPGTVWGYYRIRVYSKLYGYVSGDNLILRPEYFSKYYCTYTSTIDSIGTYLYMDYGIVNSGSAPVSYLTLSTGQESGNMYSALGGFFTVTKKSTNVSSNCKLRNVGDAENSPNGRYCDRFGNTTPTYTLSNPNYNVSIKQRGPDYVTITIDKTYDEYGLWRFRIYDVTHNTYLENKTKFSAGDIYVDGLTPDTDYTFRIEPWWAGQEISAGNNTNIQVQTLLYPPSNIVINPATNITHQSFDVSCSYDLNDGELKALTWEISGIFNDSESHVLTFDSKNNTQNFSNINGYYLKSNTEYLIRVKVTNTQGYSSNWSNYITVTTLYDPPIINDIVISSITYQSAYITVDYATYAKLLNITIEYKLESSDRYITLQSSTNNTYNLSELSPNTTYIVKATVSDSQGRFVTSTKKFTTLNDPPVINKITVTNISYYGADVSVDYKLVTEMLSFTYRVLLMDGTVYTTGIANKNFKLTNLSPYTEYRLEVTLTDVYNYSSIKSTMFTTNDDRAITLVRAGIGTTKHRAYLITKKGKTLILPYLISTILKR